MHLMTYTGSHLALRLGSRKKKKKRKKKKEIHLIRGIKVELFTKFNSYLNVGPFLTQFLTHLSSFSQKPGKWRRAIQCRTENSSLMSTSQLHKHWFKEFPHLDGLQSPLLRQEDQLLAMVDEGVQIHHIDMTSTSITVTSSLLHFVVINWHSCTSCWLSQKIVKLRVDPHVTWWMCQTSSNRMAQNIVVYLQLLIHTMHTMYHVSTIPEDETASEEEHSPEDSIFFPTLHQL